MLLKKLISSILVLVCLVVTAQSQVTVTLFDSDGKPVSDATVEHNRKVIGKTDANGSVVLEASYLNKQICFSHINFELFCEKANANVNKFTLLSNDNFLDAAVVTSYENTTRRNTVGNVSSVDMSKLPVLNTSNSLSVLQGLVPGLEIVKPGGALGNVSKVRVQGDQSLFFSSPPIYVIDGVVISEFESNTVAKINNAKVNSVLIQQNQISRGNFLDFFDFNNVESITVLKDADAVAVYGSRGANGAIVIVTKKNKKNGISLLLNNNISWQPRRLQLMNNVEYLSMRKIAIKNSNINVLNGPEFYDLTLFDSTENNDWQDILMNQVIHNFGFNMSISSYSESGSNLISFSYRPNKHFYTESGKYKNYVLNNNLHYKFFKDKLNINNVSNIGFINSDQINLDLTFFATSAPPNFPLELLDKNEINYIFKDKQIYEYSTQHPLKEMLNKHIYNDMNLINTTNIKFDVNKYISIDLKYGLNIMKYNSNTSIGINDLLRHLFPNEISTLTNHNISKFRQNLELFATNEFREVFKSLNVKNIFGVNYNSSNSEAINTMNGGVVQDKFKFNLQYYPTNFGINHEKSMYKYAGIYNRLLISNNFANLNLNYRYDGSSRFSPENRFSSFYSLGLGLTISNLNLITNKNIYFRIRGSFGRMGNDNIPDYRYLQKYNNLNSTNYPNNSTIVISNLYSKTYHWERINKLNVGFDFKYKGFNLIFDYTRSTSGDQLVNYKIPDYLGQSSIYMNFPGLLQNQSLEISANYNLKIKNNNLNLGMNFTLPKNKLIDFPNLHLSSYATTLKIGESKNLQSILSFGGVDSSGYYFYLDSNNNKTTSNYNIKLVASDVKYYGSFNLSFSFNKFSIISSIYFHNSTDASRTLNRYSAVSEFAPGTNYNNYKYLLDNFDNNTNSKFQRFVAQTQSLGAFDLKYLNNYFIRMNNFSINYEFVNKSNKMYMLGLYLNNVLLYTNSIELNYESGSNKNLPNLLNLGIQLQLKF